MSNRFCKTRPFSVKLNPAMKIVRFSDSVRIQYGILDGESIRTIVEQPNRGIKETGENFSLDAATLLVPCLPGKIIALGTNYRRHADELGMKVPEEPLIFLKPGTSVIGPDEEIIYPAMSRQVDYEGELGVVIGKLTWRVSEEEALDCVMGYTCFNDVTARDLQQRDGQWTRAKSFDTFSPVGPYIETSLDPRSLLVETYLNGELKQSGRTSDMVFGVAKIVSFISHVMTLVPGDIIATGTPVGVGPMLPGDTVEVKIEGIGTLKNTVVNP
jgi:2-keto-4-pentenoate hydratase/2-oxohepta-3-ene-1,7-dioic acid hydratase in catechol pathway